MGGWLDNIKINLQQLRWEGMEWIDLVQDRKSSWAIVNTIITSGPHNMRIISLLAENMLASEEGLCGTELVSVEE
jgi:hypothetical protein